MEKKVHCFHCENTTSFIDQLSFRATCDSCNEDLHVCKNCSFYDPSAYNECKESSAESVKDKQRNNVCEYFSAHDTSRISKTNPTELFNQAEALFKKKKQK